MSLIYWYYLNFVKLFLRRCPELNFRLSNDKLGDAISQSHSRCQNIHWNVDIDFDNYIDIKVDSYNFYVDFEVSKFLLEKLKFMMIVYFRIKECMLFANDRRTKGIILMIFLKNLHFVFVDIAITIYLTK